MTDTWCSISPVWQQYTVDNIIWLRENHHTKAGFVRSPGRDMEGEKKSKVEKKKEKEKWNYCEILQNFLL